MSPFLQLEGICFASGVMLILLALCFHVGQGLRPHWGLNWIALSMTGAGVRSFLFAWGLQGQAWMPLHEFIGCLYLSALLVALRRYGDWPMAHPVRHFVKSLAAMLAVVVAGRALGLGIYAYYGVLVGSYAYLASLLLRRRRDAGHSHVLFNTVVVLLPLLVPGIGMGLVDLDTHQMPGWASLAIAGMGLGLLLSTFGRLRQELQRELEARTAAEDALRVLNESLELRIEVRTEELQGLVAGLESFNRMVSHDLRGPLGGLAGVAELADHAIVASDTARARQLVSLMGRETRRLGLLVTQLLALARVSNGELVMRATPLDDVLAEALQILALNHGDGCLDLVQSQPLPTARVDPQLMSQVFVNLIGNALKFSRGSPHPEVVVRSQDDGPSVVIEVTDHGPGFDAEQGRKLFQPFSRLHGQRFEGSGIGLTIVKRIVERHGGQVWAEGRPLEGASFYVRLPA